MTPERWAQIKPLLAAAIELPPEQRTAAYLSGVCGNDTSLMQELAQLLAAHEAASAAGLDAPALPFAAVAELACVESGGQETAPTSPNTLTEVTLEEEARIRYRPGTRVGAYEILDTIALGGMGVVYRAVRADGQYAEQVALKIVRADLGALSVERFRAERQILASLHHPNIARILDAGTTAEGLPYLVMELIDGLPITTYCDQHTLSIRDRLQMFRCVCAAVHDAHQHLIVHRDIKPSNILVTVSGVPKLLDFGVAKLLDPALVPDHLSLTVAGLWMMTPEYASPEQFRGEPITTASDIYSLGLVLYELVVGRHAYRLPSRSPQAIVQTVLETDPERPSAAVRYPEPVADDRCAVPQTADVISRLRGESPERLRRRLAGDVDAIILKSLRKNPRERYASADQLSDDIRHHLEGLPVLARRGTALYRCRKYVVRHRIGATAAALVVLSLLTGVGMTLRETRIARANERRAERRFNDVRALAHSLMFEVHDAILTLPGATAPRRLIIQRAEEYLDSLAADAASDVSLLRELADAYTRLGQVWGDVRGANLGDSAQALRNFRRSAELREQIVAARPSDATSRRELAESYLTLSVALGQVRQIEQDQKFVTKALGILEPLATSNPTDLETQYALGGAFFQQGTNIQQGTHIASPAQSADARVSFERALTTFEYLSRAAPAERKYLTQLAYTHKHLGALLISEGQFARALAEYNAALPIDEAQIRAAPQDTNARYAITFTYSDIGYILGEQGDLDGALESYRKARAIRQEIADADPRDMRARQGLARIDGATADLRRKSGDWSAALTDERRALEVRNALSLSDPTNDIKRLQLAFTRAEIGNTYVQMAFQGHTTGQRRIALCREAASWLETPLEEIARHKDPTVMTGYLPEDLGELKQGFDRCEIVLANRSTAPR
jgi:serine/threonine protein kinase